MKSFVKNHIKNIRHLNLEYQGLFLLSFLFTTVLMISHPQVLHAHEHDTFAGDTAIYGTALIAVEPNVLFIIDTSSSMNDTIVTGDPCNTATSNAVENICDDTAACDASIVYEDTWSGWGKNINDVSSGSCANAYDRLRDII